MAISLFKWLKDIAQSFGYNAPIDSGRRNFLKITGGIVGLAAVGLAVSRATGKKPEILEEIVSQDAESESHSQGSETEYEPKYKNTIGYKILCLESRENRLGKDAAKPSDFKVLDEIIDEVKAAMPAKRVYSEADAPLFLETISNVMDKKGFKFNQLELIGVGLRNKENDCYISSMIIYSAAQVIGVPVKVVKLPNHAALKFGDKYWETTADGKRTKRIKEKSHYLTFFKMPEERIADGTYMSEMSDEKMLAVAHDNIASHLNGLDNKENPTANDRAMNHIEESIRLNSNNPETYNIKAMILWKKKNLKEAFETMDHAIELNNLNTRNFYYRGRIFEDMGEIEKAKEDYKEALRLDPGNGQADQRLKGLK